MKEQLTNERLKGLFKSNFELAAHAIRLGRYYIRSGHEMHVDEVLEEIRKHPSAGYVDELQEIDAQEDKNAENE